MRPTSLAIAVAGILALASAPASPDLLVLRDGSQVEVEGSWEVRGRLVVFRLPGGALSSLRLEEVDLEASAVATAAAAEAAERARQAPPAAPVRRDPVLVLTDRDVARADLDALEEATGEEPSEGSARAPSGPPSWQRERLEVADWSESPGAEGVVFVGKLRNTSAQLTGGLRVIVTVFDHEGELLASANAELSTTVLGPGQQATFRAQIPGVFHYERVEFDTSHVAVDSGDGEPPPEPEAEAEEVGG